MSRVADVVVWLAGVAAATAVVLLFALEGGTQDQADDGDDHGTTTVPSMIETGRVLYEQYCANCHGSEGQGGTGGTLAGELLDAYPDPAAQAAVVIAGKGAMPSFAGLLSAEQVDAVVAFTRAEWG